MFVPWSVMDLHQLTFPAAPRSQSYASVKESCCMTPLLQHGVGYDALLRLHIVQNAGEFVVAVVSPNGISK
jgi:hypothetical protein